VLERFAVNPNPLVRSLVSCTGAQFCNFALIETKSRALALIKELEAEIEAPKAVRIHWTGCPNSCGQPQVADIGLMGTKVRKEGRTVEGVDIYMGGKVGKDAHLGTCVKKSIPCEDLKPVLRQLLSEHFGATLKDGVVIAAEDVHENGSSLGKASVPAAMAIVHFAKSGKEVSCTEADSILEVAERAGIDLDSNCRAGNCGTCKQQLLEGGVKYESPIAALSEAEKQAGVILTCSAYPVGRVVLDA
jgi:ferredoxin-nitrite reductase